MIKLKTIFIGLGSNIEPRSKYLDSAIQLLKNFFIIHSISSFYETPPWGNQSLLPFVNAVIKAQTPFSPEESLQIMMKIENQLGRFREGKWSNRTIDLDILDYENETLDTEILKIPHPFLQERAFVIVPWYEIDPLWVLSNGKSIQEIFHSFSDTEIKKIQQIKK